jgi:flavin reductase (DIM6/NTAB) family NADH-FMN oxidoreductase RutF
VGIDAATFRAVLGQWPTGVTVVTTVDADEPAAADGSGLGARHGMTASSFSSVSLEPALVSVCLARSAHSHDLVRRAGVFGVSVLAKDQAEVGRRFARWDPGVDRFAGAAWTSAKTGSPLLADALGWLDCVVRHAYDGGDDTIFVGEVLAASTPRTTSPLLYHSRSWGQVADVLPDAVTVVDIGGAATELAADARDLASVEGAIAALDREGDVRLRPRLLLHGAFAVDSEHLGGLLARVVPHAPGEVVLVDDGGAGPLQVREACREAVLHGRPVPVAVRLSRAAGLAQANLLTALKSGVTRVDVGAGTLTPDDVALLARSLELTLSLDGGPADDDPTGALA